MRLKKTIVILGCFAYVCAGALALSAGGMATDLNTGLVLASGIAAMAVLLRRMDAGQPERTRAKAKLLIFKICLYLVMLGLMFLELVALGQLKQLTAGNATCYCGMTLLGAFVASRWVERRGLRG
jgi:hypothetical protein